MGSIESGWKMISCVLRIFLYVATCKHCETNWSHTREVPKICVETAPEVGVTRSKRVPRLVIVFRAISRRFSVQNVSENFPSRCRKSRRFSRIERREGAPANCSFRLHAARSVAEWERLAGSRLGKSENQPVVPARAVIQPLDIVFSMDTGLEVRRCARARSVYVHRTRRHR